MGKRDVGLTSLLLFFSQTDARSTQDLINEALRELKTGQTDPRDVKAKQLAVLRAIMINLNHFAVDKSLMKKVIKLVEKVEEFPVSLLGLLTLEGLLSRLMLFE